MTKKELATVAGYTYRRLYDIDAGLPEGKKLFVKSENGKYDLALFVQRWVAYNVDSEAGEEKSLEEVKAIHEVVKTRKTELEVARMEGSLIDVNEIRLIWSDIAKAVTQNLMRLPQKIAPRIVMMANSESIRVIVDEEIRKTLGNIADTPLPSYVLDAEKETDDEDTEG